MIASILSSAGLRVGLFTSPHLHSMVERIRLGLDPISRDRFAALFARVLPAAQAGGTPLRAPRPGRSGDYSRTVDGNGDASLP